MFTLFQEKKQPHNREAGSKETLILGPYWKLQPVIGVEVGIMRQHSLLGQKLSWIN